MPPIIQPTSLVQQPRPHLRWTVPVALWGLLSLPHHFGGVVTELHFDAPISAFILKGANIATFVWQISSVNAHAFLAPVVAPARSAQTRRIACVGGVAAADVLIVVADRGQHVRCLQVVGLVDAGLAQPDIEVHGLFFFLDRLEELDGTFFGDSHKRRAMRGRGFLFFDPTQEYQTRSPLPFLWATVAMRTRSWSSSQMYACEPS